jgi:hypothetical protein
VHRHEFVASTPDHRAIRTTEIETELSYLDAVEVCSTNLLYKPTPKWLTLPLPYDSKHSYVDKSHELTAVQSSDPYRGMMAIFAMGTLRFKVTVNVSHGRNEKYTSVVVTEEDAAIKMSPGRPGREVVPIRDLILGAATRPRVPKIRSILYSDL